MRQMLALGVIAISGMGLGLGCQILAGLDKEVTLSAASSSSGSGGSGGNVGNGGNGGGSSSSSNGMGGTGLTPECVTGSDCKAGECRTPTSCTDGACVWNNAADGMFAASQLYGACQDRVCDGQGNVKLVDTSQDPTQVYKWNNPCYLDACDAWLTPTPNNGAACTTSWGDPGKCASFNCVECLVPSDCLAGYVCVTGGKCAPLPCTDGMTNGDETDIDCGGTVCASCKETKACTKDSDCDSRKCTTMICSVPVCDDGILNQNETDIDCGGTCAIGATPKKCADFKKCLFPADCASGSCRVGQCQPAECVDQIKNQDETGIDCGGSCPFACP